MLCHVLCEAQLAIYQTCRNTTKCFLVKINSLYRKPICNLTALHSTIVQEPWDMKHKVATSSTTVPWPNQSRFSCRNVLLPGCAQNNQILSIGRRKGRAPERTNSMNDLGRPWRFLECAWWACIVYVHTYHIYIYIFLSSNETSNDETLNQKLKPYIFGDQFG